MAHVIGTRPGPEAFLFRVPGRGFALRRAPFSPVPRYLARGTRLYEANGIARTVRVLDWLGKNAALVGMPDSVISLTAAMKERFLRDTLRIWPSSDRDRIASAFRRMMVYERVPLLTDLHVDDRGCIWLRSRDSDGPSANWDVFSPTGALHARADLPAHRRILDSRGNLMVLLQTGRYGEDLVVVYRLNR